MNYIVTTAMPSSPTNSAISNSILNSTLEPNRYSHSPPITSREPLPTPVLTVTTPSPSIPSSPRSSPRSPPHSPPRSSPRSSPNFSPLPDSSPGEQSAVYPTQSARQAKGDHHRKGGRKHEQTTQQGSELLHAFNRECEKRETENVGASGTCHRGILKHSPAEKRIEPRTATHEPYDLPDDHHPHTHKLSPDTNRDGNPCLTNLAGKHQHRKKSQQSTSARLKEAFFRASQPDPNPQGSRPESRSGHTDSSTPDNNRDAHTSTETSPRHGTGEPNKAGKRSRRGSKQRYQRKQSCSSDTSPQFVYQHRDHYNIDTLKQQPSCPYSDTHSTSQQQREPTHPFYGSVENVEISPDRTKLTNRPRKDSNHRKDSLSETTAFLQKRDSLHNRSKVSSDKEDKSQETGSNLRRTSISCEYDEQEVVLPENFYRRKGSRGSKDKQNKQILSGDHIADKDDKGAKGTPALNLQEAKQNHLKGPYSLNTPEKPASKRKQFSRLVQFYKRELNNKTAKTSNPQILSTKDSTSLNFKTTTREGQSPEAHQGSDCLAPSPPRTPTIQITTPALSDASSPSSSTTATFKPSQTKPVSVSLSKFTSSKLAHQLPNTAKHKVSFISGLRRLSKERRSSHQQTKGRASSATGGTFLFPARPPETSTVNHQHHSGSGNRKCASPGSGERPHKLKVEFAVMESEVIVESSSVNRGIRGRTRWAPDTMGSGQASDDGATVYSVRDDVENDVAMLGGSRARFRQARLSLLGKPLNYKAHRRDMRYRRLQSRIYNFLERPKSWGSWLYHIAMFLFVIVCLTLGVLSSITELERLLVRTAVYLEIVMLLWIFVELCLRVWSAGCRSRYQGKAGRLRFIRRPLCIIDMILVLASIATLVVVGSTQDQFPQAVLSGLRFFQILRMVRMDRKGGTWKLLGSVVWAHRQELVTTLYIGLLGLVFSSYFVYLAEKDEPRREGDRQSAYNTTTYKPKFNNFADAIWWGVVTLCTVGYGDVVPSTWGGKVIASVSAILGISFFALPAGILGSGFALKVQQQQRQKHLNRRRVPAANLIQCLWRCYAADEHSMSTATWKPHMIPCPSPTSERTPRVNTSFVSRFSTRRRDRSSTVNSREGGSYNSNCGGSNYSNSNSNHISTGGGSSAIVQSPMTTRHHARRSAISASEEEVPNVLDSLVNRTWSHLSLATGLSEQKLQLEPLSFKKENSVSSITKESEEELDLSPRLTQLTEQHKKAIRALRKIRYFVSRRKFREARRPYDVKDVIEQYSAGHVDMLGRIKNLQGRLDQILGRQGSKSKDVYESKVCLASRIVKVERQVDDIETKVDLLVDMYKEDRKFLLQHIQHVYTVNGAPQTSEPPRLPQANTSSNTGGNNPAHSEGFKPRPILIDKQFTSEPATPTGFVTHRGDTTSGHNSGRPIIQRNLSDLSQRIKKRVTYRGLSQNHYDPPSRAQSAACFPVSSLPATHEKENTSFQNSESSGGNATDVPPPGVSVGEDTPNAYSTTHKLSSLSPTPKNKSQTHNGAMDLPPVAPKLPPPLPNSPPSSILVDTSTNPSPHSNVQFQYPTSHLPPSHTNPNKYLQPRTGCLVHPISTAEDSRADIEQENLIRLSQDSESESLCQNSVYAHNEEHEPLLSHNYPKEMSQTPPIYHQHSYPPSALSSLMGTSLATVTEQRSMDSDSGQNASDGAQSSPAHSHKQTCYPVDNCEIQPTLSELRTPSRSFYNQNTSEHELACMNEDSYDQHSHNDVAESSFLLHSNNSDSIEQRLSPPQTSSIDTPQPRVTSPKLPPVHPTELPLSVHSHNATQACSPSDKRGAAMTQQSPDALTSVSTTSSLASLLANSHASNSRHESQINASFSTDSFLEHQNLPFSPDDKSTLV